MLSAYFSRRFNQTVTLVKGVTKLKRLTGPDMRSMERFILDEAMFYGAQRIKQMGNHFFDLR